MRARTFFSSFRKWGAAGALTLCVAVAGVTFAQADGSPSATTYYACVNNSSGTIKMVGESASCSKNEQKINWAQGASSSQTYVARTGVQDFQTYGSSSSLVVAELDGLPAGSYTVTAQETATLPASYRGGEVTCTLTPGGAHAIEGAVFNGVGDFTSQHANVVVNDAVSIGAGVVIKYQCTGPATLSSDNAVITATRVDTLTDQTVAGPTGAGSLTASIGAGLASRPGTCSLTMSGTSLRPGWTMYYTVNGSGHFAFTELDDSGAIVGPATAAMDGTLDATTAIGFPASGSWEITLVGTGADGTEVTATVYSSAACDGVQ